MPRNDIAGLDLVWIAWFHVVDGRMFRTSPIDRYSLKSGVYCPMCASTSPGCCNPSPTSAFTRA